MQKVKHWQLCSKLQKTTHKTFWTAAWTHVDRMCGLHRLELSQGCFDESLFYLNGNLSTSLPQQERKQAEFFSESHCHCAVLWPLLSHLTAQWHTVRAQGKDGPSECVCVFPGLPGSGLGGCDTNPYKASIMEKQSGSNWCWWHAEGQSCCCTAPGVLPRLVDSSFTQRCCHGESNKHGLRWKNLSFEGETGPFSCCL